jgi:hypothetical protein
MSESDHPKIPTVDERIDRLNTELGALQVQIQGIEEKIKEVLKKDWLAKVATVLAVIATIVALPVGALTLWQSFFKSSKTIVSTGPSVQIRYESKEQSVTIVFDLTLQNLGNRDDAIHSMGGRVSDLQSSLFAPLGADDFVCVSSGSTGSQQTGRIFTVPKEGTVSVTCNVSIQLASLSKRVLGYSGTKQLEIVAHGNSVGLSSFSECFPWNHQTVLDMTTSSAPVVERTLNFIPCSKEELQ